MLYFIGCCVAVHVKFMLCSLAEVRMMSHTKGIK